MKAKFCLAIICFVLLSFTLFAQKDSTFLNRASNSLASYFAARPVEKVYLHLDNDYYDPGDTIWFKAYLVTGADHKLSAISNVLYVELINQKDSLLKRLTLPVTNGLSYGDFTLPADYQPGYCRIRAYTNWMRNEDAAYFYDKTIPIGDYSMLIRELSTDMAANARKAAKNFIAAKPKADVQFFPEGGELVNGLRSKIAVKAVNRQGFGEDIQGIILDDDNREIVSFSTQHLGMGAFALLPQRGKSYKAKIVCSDGSVLMADLPKAKEEGFTLTLNAVRTDSIALKVSANDQVFKKLKDSTFYVVAQQEGAIRYTAQSTLAGAVFTATIAKNRFKTGMVQFTLFSSGGQALNERVVFVQNNDKLSMSLSADSLPRQWQKITFNLDAKDKYKQAAPGSFSVTVTKESNARLDNSDAQNIFTNLLLSSSLKGYIENPGYYFTDINDKARADLDLLMLTQGYRKLLWKQVLGDGKPATPYIAEKGLEMDGMVMTPSGEPVQKGNVSITSIKDIQVIDTLTAVDGSFKFKNLAFPDTAKIIVKARKANNNGKNVAIYLKQHEYPEVDKRLTSGAQFKGPLANRQASDSPMIGQEADTSGKRLLKQVTINARKAPKKDRYNNYGSTFEYDVNLGQLKDFDNLKDAVAHKIPGVSQDGRLNLNYDRAHLSVMINGLIRAQNDLNIYNLSDIESIRLIGPSLMSGPLLIVATHQFTALDSIHIKLKEVQIKSKKLEKGGRSNQYGTDNSYTIGPDRLKDMGPILSPGMASRLPGILYSNGVYTAMIYPHPALHIVLNDRELLAGDDINNYIATQDVESIKILHGYTYKTLYGIAVNPKSQDFDDIILITTKQFAGTAVAESLKPREVSLKNNRDAKYVTSELPSGLITYRFKGYYQARQFYEPKYDDPKTARKYDPRATVYWNPGIITDKDGKGAFSYFNNGNKGSYCIVIEGIDADGNLGRLQYYYTMK